MNTIEKTHVGYISGMLVVLIVVLITVRFADVPNLSERLNFGLTITSLVLALLAIIYAVFSNSTLVRNVTIMNEAARDVSATSKSLSLVIGDLAQKTEPIPTRLQSIEQMLAQSREAMAQRPPEDVQAEDISQAQHHSHKADKTPDKGQKKVDPDGLETHKSNTLIDPKLLVSEFLKRSSFHGLILTYALRLAFDKKIPLNLIDFTNSNKVGNVQYLYGFLVAINGLGMVHLTESKFTFNILRISDHLTKESIAAEIKNRIGTEPDVSLSRTSALESVEKYF